MQQPSGKRRRGAILLLLAAILVIAAFLSVAFLLNQQPTPTPTTSPNAGSVNENVETIQINQLFSAPEFNVGGALTCVFACFASYAIFAVYKRKRAN